MQKLQLLPRGAFVLHGENDKGEAVAYKGRFSMYALESFLNSRGIDNYMQLIERMSVGMSVGEYADLLAAALNDYDREKPAYTRAAAMDVADSVFDGMGDAEFSALIMHAMGRITSITPAETTTGEAATDEQKKSKSNA